MSILSNTLEISSLEQRLDSTIAVLGRIADALERLAPRVAEEAQGDNEPIYLDQFEPEPERDESEGLKGNSDE